MKAANRSRKGLPIAALAGVLILSASLEGHSATFNLQDGNSLAQVNVGSQVGMYNWTVDGVSQLYQQWFWYRVGNTPEASIDTISAPVSTLTAGRFLSTTYTASQFTLRLDYTLSGGAAGSGTATIVENISIVNTGNSPLDFHFFQYSDFNLENSAPGDEVQLGTGFGGKFNEALQTKGSLQLSEKLEQTSFTPGADHGEAGYFNLGDPTSTLAKLNDGLPTTLNDVTAAGPGNVTWAFQWDSTLAAGGVLNISKTKLLQVPEPSALALLSLGAALCVWRKRRM